MMTIPPERLKALLDLRAPFQPAQIGKLPRITCKECIRRTCKSAQHAPSKCAHCGAYMTPAHLHIDYVGHANVTERLLIADPEWTWEPFAIDPNGLPMISTRNARASMWIKLTLLGITRIGVGTDDADAADLEKRLISDALRNAAMRFGVGLNMWSKEELTRREEPETEPATTRARRARSSSPGQAAPNDTLPRSKEPWTSRSGSPTPTPRPDGDEREGGTSPRAAGSASSRGAQPSAPPAEPEPNPGPQPTFPPRATMMAKLRAYMAGSPREVAQEWGSAIIGRSDWQTLSDLAETELFIMYERMPPFETAEEPPIPGTDV